MIIENAYKIAQESDIIILTVGGNCGWVNVTIGEGKDRCTLDLPWITTKNYYQNYKWQINL